MGLILRRPDDPPASDAYAQWFATTGTQARLDPERRLPDMDARLEAAFAASIEAWWGLGRDMAGDPTAAFAHTPAAAAFESDFGVMLAWTRLAAEIAAGDKVHLAVCDDPWLFRHIAALPGIKAGRPPALWPRALFLFARGFLARAAVAVRMLMAALRLRRQRPHVRAGAPAILVYGHPYSTADGHDGYFGPLLARHPALVRLLHTDCPAGRALALGADGRSAGLHAWGNPFFAVALMFTAWRPSRCLRAGPQGWLVRRAAARENSGGGPAMTRWQVHCQTRWLAHARPARVLWPWENMPWERDLVRRARALGIPTVGYLHTPFGPHHILISAHANADGAASLPDAIVCTGAAPRDALIAFGHERERLIVGGSLRAVVFQPLRRDARGPVFFGLPNIAPIAREMVAAAEALAAKGWPVQVRRHPMMPPGEVPVPARLLTDRPLTQQDGLSAVVYAMSSIGLEATGGGLPVVRFRSESMFAQIAVLPDDRDVPATNAAGLEPVLKNLAAAAPFDAGRYFAVPDLAFWDRLVVDPIGDRPIIGPIPRRPSN